MELREATTDDFEELLDLKLKSKEEERKLNKELVEVNKVKKHYEEYLKNDLLNRYRKIFIATDKGRIIGMILGKRYRSLKIAGYKKRGYISNLYILPEYRKKGIGKRLTDIAVRWFKAINARQITLEIYDNNIPAKELYNKLGFKTYSVKMLKKI